MGVCLHLQRYDIWEVLVFLMKLMWVWYEMSYDVYIDYISIWISWVWYLMLFYVTCCYVYNIYWTNSCWFFEHILYVYVVSKNSYISMYMSICTWLWYFIMWYTVSMIFHIFWCFNIYLLCGIVWNSDITYDIYHLNHKSQYVVQL